MDTNKSSAARSKPNDRRRLPPRQPPPVFFPYPMLPYNHPYAYAPPMGYMPPTQPSFVHPQQPQPSFVPQPPTPPSSPFWNNTCIYTQTLHPPYNCFPHPTPTPTPTPTLPYSDNACINYTPTLHPPSNSFPPPQQDLSHKILKQIEYYFSDENLATDDYLKGQMDVDNGWVPIKLIADFNQIYQMTKDIKLILDSLKYSDTVEVEGDKLRRRTTWKKWIAYRKAAARNN